MYATPPPRVVGPDSPAPTPSQIDTPSLPVQTLLPTAPPAHEKLQNSKKDIFTRWLKNFDTLLFGLYFWYFFLIVKKRTSMVLSFKNS